MLKGAMSLWNVIGGAASKDIRRQMELPVDLVLIGSDDHVSVLSSRLGVTVFRRQITGEPLLVEPNQLVIDCDRLAGTSDIDFNAALSSLLAANASRKIALALQIPAMRPHVVQQLSHSRATENARIAAVSALPGIIPLTDWLLPATAAGDMIVLTRNQIMLLLEVAACYGRPPDPKERVKELLPVIGSAFGWRAIARELVGLVPGGIGVAVKALIAYAGTYSVGQASAFYYSGGTSKMTAPQLRTFYRRSLTDGFVRARTFLRLKQS